MKTEIAIMVVLNFALFFALIIDIFFSEKFTRYRITQKEVDGRIWFVPQKSVFWLSWQDIMRSTSSFGEHPISFDSEYEAIKFVNNLILSSK